MDVKVWGEENFSKMYWFQAYIIDLEKFEFDSEGVIF